MPTDFSITHRVEFSETDMAGVVHFSNYFRWMELVEQAFFRSRGLSVVINKPDQHVSWPRISASCEYLGPARFEDEITLKLGVSRVGEKSFSYEVDFYSGPNHIAKGKITSVCCTILGQEFSPITIPSDIRGKLTAAQA